jgi:hypothetical protein
MFYYDLHNCLRDKNSGPSFRDMIFREIRSAHKSVKKSRLGSYCYKSIFLQVMTPVCAAVAIPFFLIAIIFTIFKGDCTDLKNRALDVIKELTYSLYITIFMPLIFLLMPCTQLKKD